MFLKRVKGIATLFLFVSMSASSYASYILNGASTVKAIELSQSPVDFYNKDAFHSNTGFERPDSLVFFMASYLGTDFLFGLFDDGTTSNLGNFRLSINDLSNSTGSLLFVDETNDIQVGIGPTYTFNFWWGNGLNDGLVYQLAPGDNELEINADLRRGLDDIFFVDFSGSNPEFIELSNSFTIRSVASPAIGSLGLILCIVALRRRFR